MDDPLQQHLLSEMGNTHDTPRLHTTRLLMSAECNDG